MVKAVSISKQITLDALVVKSKCKQLTNQTTFLC